MLTDERRPEHDEPHVHVATERPCRQRTAKPIAPRQHRRLGFAAHASARARVARWAFAVPAARVAPLVREPQVSERARSAVRLRNDVVDGRQPFAADRFRRRKRDVNPADFAHVAVALPEHFEDVWRLRRFKMWQEAEARKGVIADHRASASMSASAFLRLMWVSGVVVARASAPRHRCRVRHGVAGRPLSRA